MRKFQRLGLIDYMDGLKVINALHAAVLNDPAIATAARTWGYGPRRGIRAKLARG
jgi:hypothetical protein